MIERILPAGVPGAEEFDDGDGPCPLPIRTSPGRPLTGFTGQGIVTNGLVATSVAVPQPSSS
ncbi:hypothetical protein IL992_33465 [Microbispora sp. NEAU-D428]|uniref:hypothetical protein n=1 Tax=Microbispora sitophila TaxID=2771537 RepID=UPI0018679936|nr:hypothetical protein [Microbispora sitophila]MBE3014051.1 hypothetical protein [Microbispora sitophila]